MGVVGGWTLDAQLEQAMLEREPCSGKGPSRVAEWELGHEGLED